MDSCSKEFMGIDINEKIRKDNNCWWICKYSIRWWFQGDFLGHTIEEAKQKLIKLGKDKNFPGFMNGKIKSAP